MRRTIVSTVAAAFAGTALSLAATPAHASDATTTADPTDTVHTVICVVRTYGPEGIVTEEVWRAYDAAGAPLGGSPCP